VGVLSSGLIEEMRMSKKKRKASFMPYASDKWTKDSGDEKPDCYAMEAARIVTDWHSAWDVYGRDLARGLDLERTIADALRKAANESKPDNKAK
jgi:hypothetical protein